MTGSASDPKLEGWGSGTPSYGVPAVQHGRGSASRLTPAKVRRARSLPGEERSNRASWRLRLLVLSSAGFALVSCLSGSSGASSSLSAGESWTIATSPNPGSRTDNLLGISCDRSTFCMAAGADSNTALLSDQGTLVEKWSGKTWTVVSSPSPGNNGDTLDGISCTSTAWCVAVGSYTDGPGYGDPLVERWNGKTWAVAPNPELPGSRFGSSLNSVSCTSPSSCTAAGAYAYAGDHDNTLVEEWNGRTWTVVSSPSPESSNDLLGISCTGPTFCMAAGSYEQVSGTVDTLVEEWNGKTWAVVPSPSPGASSNDLFGITCTGPTFCMAAGDDSSTTASNDQATLLERWNGTSWAVVSSPSPGNNGDSLDAVSCTSTASCVAVGSYANGSASPDPLVERWNGKSWAVGPASDPKSALDGSDLRSVSCTSTALCVAAGSASYAADRDHTLVEQSG